MSDPIPIAQPIGVAGERLPDGSVPVILNDHGRAIFGPFFQFVVLQSTDTGDTPVIVVGGCIADTDVVAAAIREAIAVERERCAKLVESYDARDEDGEFVRPELGNWTGGGYDEEAVYTPDEFALAKAIRGGKP